MTRDELIDIVREVEYATASPEQAVNRILALLPPREPTPAMVEAMVPFVYGLGQQCYDNARAAWAAGYAAGEETARAPGAVGSSTTPAYEGPRTGGTGSPGVRDE